MLNEYLCYRCKRKSGEIQEHKISLFAVYAPGTYFICPDCIRDINDECGEIALYHPLQGISFHSEENAKKLLGKEEKNNEN